MPPLDERGGLLCLLLLPDVSNAQAKRLLNSKVIKNVPEVKKCIEVNFVR